MSHGGYVPYMVLTDETSVVHSNTEDESLIQVYFEKPDDEFFFKYLEIKLTSLEILQSHGFEPHEVNELIRFAIRNHDLIVKYAKVGGIMSA